MSHRLPAFLFIASLLIALALLLAPPFVGLNAHMLRAAAVCILAVGLWSTNVTPSYYGSLIFVFAAMVLAVAPAPTTFSGFYAGATWLVFGGLVIGLGVQRTGLDVRLVRGMLGLFPKSYLALSYGVFLVGSALTLVVPSASGRVALIVPIVAALAQRLGFGGESKGRAGLVLAATMGTMTPGFSILPANVPNMGLYGAVESIYHIQLAYFDYLTLNFPVLGVAAMLVYPSVICLLFREPPTGETEHETPKPWSGDEFKLLFVLLVALALWVTDRWHGISPAWVALGAALIIVVPKFGVLPVRALARELDYGPVLFVAGIIGLGAVATETGLGPWLADRLLGVVSLEPGHDARNYAIIVGIATVVGIFTTIPAQPSIMAPLAQHMAEAAHWPLMGVLMVPVSTWSMFPFYYQTPPVVLAVALANLRIGWATHMLLTYMIFGLLVVQPLHFLWGHALGYFAVAN